MVARPSQCDETEINQNSSNEEQYIFDEIEEDLLIDRHRHTMETSFIQNLQISPIAKLNIDKTSNRSSMTADSSCSRMCNINSPRIIAYYEYLVTIPVFLLL